MFVFNLAKYAHNVVGETSPTCGPSLACAPRCVLLVSSVTLFFAWRIVTVKGKT